MIGTKLAHYEVTRHLGSGGMGEVYEAADSKLGRSVALKFLSEPFVHDADRIARFQREARVLAALTHPNIAGIYGSEESGGRHYLVMELVSGETLAERIRRGPVPVDEALAIARQITEALEAAHEKGIVHRDLKPANVKLTSDGKVKVLDFGLAKAFDDGPAESHLANSPTRSFAATQQGVILGTAAYMSPEQARGAAVDRRTDIFAFGAVLYEMLTGTQAFAGETVSDILAAVIRAEPDWKPLPSGTPAAILRLLRRCLQKDRNRRLDTAGSARIEIDEALTEPETKAPLSLPVFPEPRRLPWALVAALSTAVFVLAIPTYQYLRIKPAAAPSMRLNVVTPATTDAISFAISPDGSRLVFVAAGTGEPRLWLRPLDSETAQPLPGTEGAKYPFWSPDSKSVGFFAGSQLSRIDIGGGSARPIANANTDRGATWGPDNVILFGDATGPLRRVSAEGGQSVQVTTLGSHTSHRFPYFLPGGRRFLFYALGAGEDQGIYLGSLDEPLSQKPKRLTAADTAGVYLAPGWLLFVRNGTLVAQRFDQDAGTLSGDTVAVADSVSYDPTLSIGAFSVSTEGMIAYRPGGAGKRQLTWFDRKGNTLGTMGPIDDSLVAPTLSPDGSRVALHRTVRGNTDVWIFDSIRSSQFTFDPGLDRFPVWSPDGEEIFFDSTRKGSRKLFKSRTGAAGTEVLVEVPGNDQAALSWSSDGRYLLYTVTGSTTGRDIWVLPTKENEKPHAILNESYDERNAQFSPDGRWIAYLSNVTNQYSVEVRPFPGPGGHRQVSASGGVQPRWSRDGKELYYVSPDAKLMAVPVTLKGDTLEPGAPAVLFSPRIWGGAACCTLQQYDVTRDGRFLINIALDDAAGSPVTLLLNWKPLAK